MIKEGSGRHGGAEPAGRRMRKENEVMSNKERLTERWTQGRISEAMLRVYVRKGIITKADFEEICGKKY